MKFVKLPGGCGGIEHCQVPPGQRLTTRPVVEPNGDLWGNKTEDEFYKTLFPVAPSTATAPVANDSQNLFVRALIDRIESDDRYAALRPRAEVLKTSQAELESAIQERESLRTPELRASVDLRTALDSGRRAYNKLYPKLTLLFESKGFLETFFIPNGRSVKTDPTIQEDASAETGEGVPAAL